MSTSAIQVVVIKDQSTVVQVVDVQPNASLQRQPVSIQAQKGFRYQLKDLSSPQQAAPAKVQIKRVGKDLHLVFQENADLADLILEDYYEVMQGPSSGLLGEVDGFFYEYTSFSADVSPLTLADGASHVYSVLGGLDVVSVAAPAVGASFVHPAWAALGALGAAGGGGGGGGGGSGNAVAAALRAISAAAQDNSATNGSPDVATYAAAGVSGVNAGNLAAINSALNSAAITSAQVASAADVQVIVDAFNAILAEANGAATDATAQNPSAAQYAAIGVTGVNSGPQVSLLGEVIGHKTVADVGNLTQLQALANAVQAVMEGHANPTQLALLGVSDVTADNITAVQAALAAANDADQLSTLSGLQALVSAINTAAAHLAAKAENNTALHLGVADYEAAGVQGVTTANLLAINSALNTGTPGELPSAKGISGAEADSPLDLQAIVNAYNKILAAADGTDGNTLSAAIPSQADYAAIGVSVDVATAALMSDVIDGKATSAIHTVPQIQALADAAQATLAYTGNNTAPSLAQLQALFGGVQSGNLASVLSALAAANTAAAQANAPVTQAQLQTLVMAINNALDTVLDAAVEKTASSQAIGPIIYAAAGIQHVNASNVDLINSLIDTAGVTPELVSTVPQLQALVNAAIKLNALANGNPDGMPMLSQDDVAALGLSAVVNTPAALSLFNQVIDSAPASVLGTDQAGAAVVNLASIVQRLVQTAAGASASPALTASDLQAIGLLEIDPAQMADYLAALATTLDDGTGIDTLPKLQNLVRDINWSNAEPKMTIAEASDGIGAAEVADGIEVLISMPAHVALGDVLRITVKNTQTQTLQTFTHTLTQQDLGKPSAKITLPASLMQSNGQAVDGNYTLTSELTRADGATTSTHSFSFDLDTTPPTTVVNAIAGDEFNSTSAILVGEFSALERGTSATELAAPLVISGTTNAEVGQIVQVNRRLPASTPP